MWNLQEWVFFKKNLTIMLTKNKCQLTFKNNTSIICNSTDVQIDDVKSLWVLNFETRQPSLIDLTSIIRIEILD